jgi:glycosyltransferase involved in cell wall biosynthesis
MVSRQRAIAVYSRLMGAERRARKIACVVLSVGAEPELVDAVASVLEQEPQPEIVVVNSGGGDAADVLRQAGIAAPVVERPDRVLPGAARNLGVEATEAPYVAFLAADCRAEPGWARARLAAHLGGAPAVASVITNACPESRVADAAYLRLHFARMPDTPPERRRLYGVSYDRDLFERFGSFREDLREGEDTEFNARLPADLRIESSPQVRTAHRHPIGIAPLIRDQYARGRRNRFYEDLSTATMLRVTLIKEPMNALRQARQTSGRRQRRRLLAAWPLVPPAATAFTAGLLSARRRRPVQAPAARGN